jgi:calpain-15
VNSSEIGASRSRCAAAIDRLKVAPSSAIKSFLSTSTNKQFKDSTFYTDASLYWKEFTSSSIVRDYKSKISSKEYFWARLTSVYKKKGHYSKSGVSLFGRKGVDWNDAIQGETATCYVIGGMAASAEFDHIVKSIFPGNQEYNQNGIYSLRLFLRGKPWTIIVDDIFLFKNRRTAYDRYTLKAARVGDDRSLWGPIVEKAWAKIVGTYRRADYGLLKTGIRVITGAPTFGYSLTSINTKREIDATFNRIYDANRKKYIINL